MRNRRFKIKKRNRFLLKKRISFRRYGIFKRRIKIPNRINKRLLKKKKNYLNTSFSLFEKKRNRLRILKKLKKKKNYYEQVKELNSLFYNKKDIISAALAQYRENKIKNWKLFYKLNLNNFFLSKEKKSVFSPKSRNKRNSLSCLGYKKYFMSKGLPSILDFIPVKNVWKLNLVSRDSYIERKEKVPPFLLVKMPKWRMKKPFAGYKKVIGLDGNFKKKKRIRRPKHKSKNKKINN